MKVLFVVPKFPARTYPGKTMAPDYLAGAIVNKVGLSKEEIEILDLDVLGKNALEQELKKKNYDLVGISFLSFQLDYAMDIAEITNNVLKKQSKRNPNSRNYVPIIVGGHGTSQSEQVIPIYKSIDSWIIGEGFETIVDIANSVKNGNFLSERNQIFGIKYETGGEVITTAKRPLITNLDDFIPLRLHHYDSYNFEVFDFLKTAQMMTQFGCAGACTFCHEGTAGKHLRYRSLSSIENEIKELVNSGYRAIYFDDSTFAWDKNRTLKLIKIMKFFHDAYDIVWGYNTRVDCEDEEISKAATAAGCVYSFNGVESLEIGPLRGMGKVRAFTPSKDYSFYNNGISALKSEEEYIDIAKKTFKRPRLKAERKSAFLIFGGPSEQNGVMAIETPTEAKSTILQTVWDLDPDYISINIMRFIPDAIMSHSPKYSLVRGQSEPIHAGYFSTKWRKQNKIKDQDFRSHPIYMAFEAAGDIYPVSPHMTPEYCYSILEYLVNEVNNKTTSTGRMTEIVVDKSFKQFMYRDEKEIYHLTSFEEMSKEKQTIFAVERQRDRIKQYMKPLVALAAAAILTLGTIMQLDRDKLTEAQKDQHYFFTNYYPELLATDGKLRGDIPMSILDYIGDELDAFVRGDTTNTIYGPNSRLIKFIEEGKEYRKLHS